jgi:hypothetical protein
VAAGRTDAAIALTENSPAPTTTAAPQWRVIDLITVVAVRLQAADHIGVTETLEAAVREATIQRLPYQLQRVRGTDGRELHDIRTAESQSLD